jgi:hypothetical protein
VAVGEADIGAVDRLVELVVLVKVFAALLDCRRKVTRLSELGHLLRLLSSGGGQWVIHRVDGVINDAIGPAALQPHSDCKKDDVIGASSIHGMYLCFARVFQMYARVHTSCTLSTSGA